MANPTKFDVLGTEMIITDMNFPAASGTEEFKQMFSTVKIDLTNGDNDCLFLFAKFPQEPQTMPDGTAIYRYGAIQAKAKALIALVQQALEQFVQDRTGDPTIKMDIDGVYNCKDAQIMLGVAQEARQTPLGAADFWPLGPTEFYYLLTQSRMMQGIIAQAVVEQGQTYGAAYQGAMILLPMQEVPALVFRQADVPSVCAGATPPVDPGDGTTPTCMPGYVWDSEAAACVASSEAACPPGQVWSTSLGKCVPSGTDPTGAGGDKDEGDWWKWPLGIGAGFAGIGGLYYWYKNRS